MPEVPGRQAVYLVIYLSIYLCGSHMQGLAIRIEYGFVHHLR